MRGWSVRIVEPERLQNGRGEGEHAGDGDGGRTVAAKGRTRRDLAPDGENIGQRPVEIAHRSPKLCNAK